MGGAEHHPLRHYAEKPGDVRRTFIYIIDTSPEGVRLAKKLGDVDKVPQGPIAELARFGLLKLEKGDWIMARDLHGTGDAIDDVVQAYVPMSQTVRQQSQDSVNAACTMAFGSQSERNITRLPVELSEDGVHKIAGVKSNTSAYALGFTWERPTNLSTPNASTKVRNGEVGPYTQMRNNLLKSIVEVFNDGFEEAPIEMQEGLSEIADAMNVPQLGNSKNKFCPTAQLNIAKPQLHASRQGMAELGFFGGDHEDSGDLGCGLSAMTPISDLPDEYEAGRFHILPLGVYVVLDEIDI
ncbi:hypothetical protein K474DRAFT_1714314, partial [Panus rudis PR-1116 ss-1]